LNGLKDQKEESLDVADHASSLSDGSG